MSSIIGNSSLFGFGGISQVTPITSFDLQPFDL